jgi:hypothetical protein
MPLGKDRQSQVTDALMDESAVWTVVLGGRDPTSDQLIRLDKKCPTTGRSLEFPIVSHSHVTQNYILL